MKLIKIVIPLLLVLALIGAGMYFYTTCSGTPLVQKIDKSIPDITSTPFEVSTYTHIYYAEKAVKNDDGSVTMWGWYERENGKWVAHDKEITLLQVLHPNIRRREK